MSFVTRSFAGPAAGMVFTLALCGVSHSAPPSAAVGCVRYNTLALPDYWTLLAMDWEYIDGWVCPPAQRMRVPGAPAFTWTGLDVGANATHGWGRHGDFTPNPVIGLGGGDAFAFASYIPLQSTVSTDPKGWGGGIEIGYNRAFGRFVFGVVTDYSWLNISGSG
jgi:hypothetical protein